MRVVNPIANLRSMANGHSQIDDSEVSLTQLCSPNFDDRVCRRGERYYRNGAVTVINGTSSSVSAWVAGSRRYDVRLLFDENTLEVACDCAYFGEDKGLCKHIWATLIAAETENHLEDATFKRVQHPVAVVPAAEAEELLDDDGTNHLGFDDDDDLNESRFWDGVFDDDAPTAFRPWYDETSTQGKQPPSRGRWDPHLATLLNVDSLTAREDASFLSAGRQILYVLDLPSTRHHGHLTIDVVYRERRQNGDWGRPRTLRLGAAEIGTLPDANDQRILTFLTGAGSSPPWAGSGYSVSLPSTYQITGAGHMYLVDMLGATGRFVMRRQESSVALESLTWEKTEPWKFFLQLRNDSSRNELVISGHLRRGEEILELDEPDLLLAGGLVFIDNQLYPLDDAGAFQWISVLRKTRTLAVPVSDTDQIFEKLLQLPRLPALELPDELKFEEVEERPVPQLKIEEPKFSYRRRRCLTAELSFAYNGVTIPCASPWRGVWAAHDRNFILRDHNAETGAADVLFQLGVRSKRRRYSRTSRWELTAKKLPGVVNALVGLGWHVEADGKLYKACGQIDIEVTSGIDWFELHGSVAYGEHRAQLPALLAALRRGEDTVALDDGSLGILPEKWLKDHEVFLGLGEAMNDHIRFKPTQVALLDALLMANPQATFDERFSQVRDELTRFDGISPVDPPPGFTGSLRPYQKEGMGWFDFLKRFSFGGCLADDMGLGKTVQVLALLESRRIERTEGAAPAGTSGAGNGTPKASLIVVPKSLVFNWKQEAAKFTPAMRVLEHTDVNRTKPGAHFEDYDIVITTYGILRRDAAAIKDIEFNYCILDESQAIKNANTSVAKAVRLVRSHHRLALSGTPIENNLGELWSLFEFLNPGMMGTAGVFRKHAGSLRDPDDAARHLLARVLRPFLLRRRKGEVATDLPVKTEQTLYCELESSQRKLYDELRSFYQESLLARVDRDGIARSKVHVLEALLRLRQAACHPALIDATKFDEGSAKLDMLIPQVTAVIDDGHKALVFSQFTSFLAIVRARLDGAGISYTYLDGRTRKREKVVDCFQNDPQCRLFLISLKAGGHGLNLTAADYVFLLDPWWNPAVEAQAIDRAHRIGQERQVFAYRLIALDTVEEKVLQLQDSKRELADAIINADNSLIRNLSREDLDLLLS